MNYHAQKLPYAVQIECIDGLRKSERERENRWKETSQHNWKPIFISTRRHTFLSHQEPFSVRFSSVLYLYYFSLVLFVIRFELVFEQKKARRETKKTKEFTRAPENTTSVYSKRKRIEISDRHFTEMSVQNNVLFNVLQVKIKQHTCTIITESRCVRPFSLLLFCTWKWKMLLRARTSHKLGTCALIFYHLFWFN